MPFHSPIPEKDANSSPQRQDGGGIATLVQAERLMQIALVLPCALLIGWALGWSVDHFLHSHWGVIAGLILGIISGMVSAVRMALDAGKAKKSNEGNDGK